MSTGTTTAPGRRLRAQREAAGLTQYDLARLSGCSDRYIRLLETGAVPCRSRVLPDILRVLHAPHNDVAPAGNRRDEKVRDDGAQTTG